MTFLRRRAPQPFPTHYTHDRGKKEDPMDITSLQDAYRVLLVAAATADSGDAIPAPPDGEWNADQILAHVSLVSAATIAAASAIASGANTTYDNRTALDPWTIQRVIALAGGNAGLQDRIARQGEALCAIGGSVLREAELNTLVPTLLLSNDALLVNQPMPLRDLLTGLAGTELPGHTRQLLALLPDGAGAEAAT
jgi:hypothetical protein